MGLISRLMMYSKEYTSGWKRKKRYVGVPEHIDTPVPDADSTEEDVSITNNTWRV